MIKAVFFDYGQVITFAQDPKTVGRIADLAGVEREKFEPVLWALRGEYDRGAITAHEYYRRILSAFDLAPDKKIIDKMIDIDFWSWTNINPHTELLMEDIKRAGYILGILSNMPHDFLGWVRENVSVLSLVQISLFSCEVNLIKPNEAIYQKLLSVSGLKGEEIVFFDDKPENVEAAKALGIKAYIWEDCGIARGELALLGVKL